MSSSRRVLEEAVKRAALRPPVAFDVLADVHVPLAELTSYDCERRLAEHGRGGAASCACVIGGRGEGKSSLIAAAAATLGAERYFCARVRAFEANPLTREEFTLHIGREIVQLLPRTPSATLKRLASTVTRTTGGHALGAKGAQIRSAAEQVTHEQGPADRFEALGELAEVARSAGHPLVLVIEDTDPYMPPAGGAMTAAQAAERANAFIGGPLQWLAREAPCASFVAVHDAHAKLLDAPVERIVLPDFSNAADAIGTIAVRYLRQHGLHVAEPTDLIEERALGYMAGLLEERSLRDVLRLLPDAAERAVADNSSTEVIRHVDVADVA